MRNPSIFQGENKKTSLDFSRKNYSTFKFVCHLFALRKNFFRLERKRMFSFGFSLTQHEVSLDFN
jgi:pullulanase/glycogen debranching enzyme